MNFMNFMNFSEVTVDCFVRVVCCLEIKQVKLSVCSGTWEMGLLFLSEGKECLYYWEYHEMPDSSRSFTLISRLLNLFHLDIYITPFQKTVNQSSLLLLRGGKESFKTFYWWQVSLVLKLTEIIIVWTGSGCSGTGRWKWSNKVWAMENSQVKLITRCGKSATVKFLYLPGPEHATPGPTLLAKKTELSRWKRGLRLVSFNI